MGGGECRSRRIPCSWMWENSKRSQADIIYKQWETWGWNTKSTPSLRNCKDSTQGRGRCQVPHSSITHYLWHISPWPISFLKCKSQTAFLAYFTDKYNWNKMQTKPTSPHRSCPDHQICLLWNSVFQDSTTPCIIHLGFQGNSLAEDIWNGLNFQIV